VNAEVIGSQESESELHYDSWPVSHSILALSSSQTSVSVVDKCHVALWHLLNRVQVCPLSEVTIFVGCTSLKTYRLRGRLYVQVRDRQQALVNAVMNLQVP
jgi:hypothetical protein